MFLRPSLWPVVDENDESGAEHLMHQLSTLYETVIDGRATLS